MNERFACELGLRENRCVQLDHEQFGVSKWRGNSGVYIRGGYWWVRAVANVRKAKGEHQSLSSPNPVDPRELRRGEKPPTKEKM